MVVGYYIKVHMARIHGICALQTRGFDEIGGGTTTYVMSSPKVLHEVICMGTGCPVVVHSAGRLREHFMIRHFRFKLAVFQERKEPLPRCELCGMKILAGRLIGYRKTARCNRNTHMRRRRRDVAIAARCLEATFSLKGEEEA